MMTKIKQIALWGAVLPLALAGCSADKQWEEVGTKGEIRMQVTASRLNGDSAGDDDARIGNLVAFRIVEQQVVELFDHLTVNEHGWCSLKPEEKRGELYWVANGAEIAGLTGVKSLEELYALTLSGAEMKEEGVAMTGKVELTANWKPEVNMKRAVARVDVDAKSAGVKVKEVTIANAATTGYLWNATAEVPPVPAATEEERKVLFKEPVEKGKQVVCYLYEQQNSELMVNILAEVGGVDYRLQTQLPSLIRRNTVYTLKVNGVGGKLTVEVKEASWGGTDEVDAGEEKLEFTVDSQASNLPEGVTVSERMDRVEVPYTETAFTLVMNAKPGTELKVSGSVDGVEVTPLPAARTTADKLTVQVKSATKSFTDLGGSIQLQAVDGQGVLVGEITLDFQANPCRMTGDLVFDETNSCRFEGNVEGELALLFLPPDMQARLNFDLPENENGKNWMQLVQRESDGAFRLLAGWCETYRKAMNGKTETVQLIISDAKANEIVYTISRVYRSIPTVKVAGNYWSMFPMVGNSKKLEEQTDLEILPMELLEHLRTCTDEEFIRLQGTHYQGGNPEGLTIYYDQNLGTFAYRGFSETVKGMNTVKDEEMLPEGWRLPTQDEISALSWGPNSWVGYANGRTLNANGKQHTIWERREVMIDGHPFDRTFIWGIRLNWGPQIVFSGFRTQGGIKGISATTSLLPAARGPLGSPWELCVDGGTCGLVRYHSYSPLSTYTLHSIKVMPEYVYP